MSDLGFNKIAGAVLATGLAIVGLKELTSVIYKVEPVEKPGYAITVAEEAGEGGAAAVEVAIDWGTVLPTADIAAGEAGHNLVDGGLKQKKIISETLCLSNRDARKNFEPGDGGIMPRRQPREHTRIGHFKLWELDGRRLRRSRLGPGKCAREPSPDTEPAT